MNNKVAMEPVQPLSKEDQLRFGFFCLIEKQEKKYNDRYLSTLFFKDQSVIQTTEYLVENAGPNETFSTQTTISADDTGKFSAIFICIWLSLVLTTAITRLYNTHKAVSFVFIFIVAAGALLLLLKRLPASKSYTIELGRQGITIEGNFYLWSSILETYIVRRPAKSPDDLFLLFGLNNGELLRFKVGHFSGMFSKKIDTLIRAIEFYKNENKIS